MPEGRPAPGSDAQPFLHATAVLLATLCVGALAWLFWSTAISTSLARVAALRTIEPYAWAVHEQLVFNRAFHGEWFQTIHAGYDDAWTWSGHRAPTLWLTSLVYPLIPSAVGMARLQIGAVVAGALPAAWIGRRALRSPWGLALGGGLYLLHPAILALSLQDYQDLVFAVPALTFTLWTMRARWAGWVVIGALVGVLPREECVPLVVACALVTTAPPRWRGARWKRWALNAGLAVLVAGAYAATIQALFPISADVQPSASHDTPAVNAIRSVLAVRSLDDLPGLAHISSFYSLTWAPAGLLALLSPLTALPGALLLVLHLTVEYGHGVDRWWGGHAHHLAPVMPFFVVATIEGCGRLLRWIAGPPEAPSRRRRGLRRALAAPLGAGLLGWAAWWVTVWAGSYNLVRTAWPTPPEIEHPIWSLVRRLPPDAVPVVSVSHALAASGRSVSFTWEESLHDQAGGEGLGAATHLLAPRDLTSVIEWAMAMDGAEVVDAERGCVTIAWEPGARDGSGRGRDDGWPEVRRWRPDHLGTSPVPGAPPPRTGY